jgi:hypothetical protein
MNNQRKKDKALAQANGYVVDERAVADAILRRARGLSMLVPAQFTRLPASGAGERKP